MELYRYRSFNENLLDSLMHNRLYYCDPSDFNDPMDSKVDRIQDASDCEMELAIRKIITKHGKDGSSGDDTIRQIAIQADEHYDANYDEIQIADREEAKRCFYSRCLDDYLHKVITHFFPKKYVTCFSSTYENDLLWSYYANGHKGLCIEYAPFGDTEVVTIEYASDRRLRTSLIIEWTKRWNRDILQKIKKIIYFTKDDIWSHEKEYRSLSSSHGIQASSFDIISITFGMRTPDYIIGPIYHFMRLSETKINFFRMHSHNGRLIRHAFSADPDEYDEYGSRTPYLPQQSAKHIFDDLALKFDDDLTL